jgi:glyoxylase-like metal-dependent hydrolase (beta-lactamase superfamily II)
LIRALEAGEALQVVDVRSPARVLAGRIDLVPDGRFHNVLGSVLSARTDLAGTGFAPDLPTVVVCGHGNDSRVVGAHLRSLGLDARSLRGGMASYMNLVIERPLTPPPSLDRLVQFDRIGKGALAYLLVSDGEALVIDPPRDFAPLLDAARAVGARVVGVADTHVHADYISGAPALAHATGAPYWLHPADSSYAYDGTPGRLAYSPLADGATLRVGRCALAVQHTPGHTEGSTSLVAGDALVFSGDFVFVESIGRPDLGDRSAEWAERLWRSLETAKRTWAAGALVLPGHYSSERERRPDRSIGAPFGELLRTNAALLIRDRDEFLAWAGRPSTFPESYRVIKAVNVGLRVVDEREADELDLGRNECAVSRPQA